MILDTIKFNYTIADDQSKAWTPSHIVYRCTIKHNNKQYSFTYQCNRDTQVTLRDVMECVLLDADTINMCADAYELMKEFGYDDYMEAKRIYNACKRTNNAIHRLFTQDELSDLYEEIGNY